MARRTAAGCGVESTVRVATRSGWAPAIVHAEPAAPVVTDEVEPLDPGGVGQGHDVVGQLGQGVRLGVRLARAGPRAVAALVRRQRAESGLDEPVADGVPGLPVLGEPVQEEDRGAAGSPRSVTSKVRPSREYSVMLCVTRAHETHPRLFPPAAPVLPTRRRPVPSCEGSASGPGRRVERWRCSSSWTASRGSPRDARHAKEIDVAAWSLGVTNSGSDPRRRRRRRGPGDLHGPRRDQAPGQGVARADARGRDRAAPAVRPADRDQRWGSATPRVPGRRPRGRPGHLVSARRRGGSRAADGERRAGVREDPRRLHPAVADRRDRERSPSSPGTWSATPRAEPVRFSPCGGRSRTGIFRTCADARRRGPSPERSPASSPCC